MAFQGKASLPVNRLTLIGRLCTIIAHAIRIFFPPLQHFRLRFNAGVTDGTIPITATSTDEPPGSKGGADAKCRSASNLLKSDQESILHRAVGMMVGVIRQ